MTKASVTRGKIFFVTAASALLLAGSSVCASDTADCIESSAKKSFKSTAKTEATTGQKIDDASITAQVRMSLFSHRWTGSMKTRVQTTDGVVTLTGTTKNAAEKALVTKLATDVNGVSSVVNKMTLQAAVSTSHPPLLPPQNLRIVSQ
jgi:osmotically-inducible protein OsmY